MNFNDGTTKLDLDKSTTAVSAAHEDADLKDGDSAKDNLENSAMESAKRATNRIHADEQEIPGSTLFTK